jgi:naphtho-gamma-pyrone polyketide synthase
MQMADYMLKGNNISSETTGLDVANVKVDKPLIAMTDRDSQLLRISASADWTTNLVSFSLYSVNADGKKAAEHASCEVKITQNQRWLEDWRRVSYLIESRIKSLNKAVDEEDAHKMKRGIVYKLFSSLVDYDASYQGMQEVILDSKELEATAKVSFQVDQNGFFINPCWIDSLGHIAGFIMNGNDNVHSKTQVFVNHGWDRMRCSTTFSRNKVYRTYNKMQLVGGTMYAGDTYILDGDTIVAVFEGVKVSNRETLKGQRS